MKILVKINNNKLIFINRKKLNAEYKNMLNTNVISHDELVFSDNYIIENPKIVITFFNDLIKNYNLTTAVFQNNDVAKLIIPILNKLKGIQIINFDSDEAISYRFCETIIKCPDVKCVIAQYIPKYLFELFDKNDIVAQCKSEILFTSKFMSENGLSTYSQIYYKNEININFPLTNEDFEDFECFISINKHLKIINVNTPNRFHLEEIITILIRNNKKNIKIIIHGDVHEIDTVEYLRKNNKVLQKKYNICFKLKYSEDYLKDNIVKQTNNNILKTCGILILIIILISFAYIFYDNYHSMQKDAKIQNEIKDFIKNNDSDDTSNLENNLDGKYIVNDYLKAVKEINSDTVGWLKVNNTNIDYAIMQTNNNQYYLNYNIYKEKDENGWLFLDYENNPEELDDNNIIYGHNRYLNGVMFGTLNKVTYKSWYTKSENQIISYDTLYGSYKFKVFSIYEIETTNDYLTVNFETVEKKIEFFNKILSRSIHKFNVTLDENSKILTLSTCTSDTTRLVVHAVLIEE